MAEVNFSILTRAFRRIGWFAVDLWHAQVYAPPLRIDARRMNEEDRLDRRRQLLIDDDPEYRAKVKKRMRLGLTREQMRPLYVTPVAKGVRQNIVPMPVKKEATR